MDAPLSDAEIRRAKRKDIPGTYENMKGTLEAKRARNAEWMRKAMSLRISGASDEQIAIQLGCSQTWVRLLIHKALANLAKATEADAGLWREFEARRLDELFLVVNGMLRQGLSEADKAKGIEPLTPRDRLACVNQIKALGESRRKLFGLDLGADVSVKVDVDVQQTIALIPVLKKATDQELADMLDRLTMREKLQQHQQITQVIDVTPAETNELVSETAKDSAQ
jgi:hypothetical protein